MVVGERAHGGFASGVNLGRSAADRPPALYQWGASCGNGRGRVGFGPRFVISPGAGRAFEVRYADDAVLVFEREDDARWVFVVLAKRLGKYGLRLHLDKTRMVEFRRPAKRSRGGSQRECNTTEPQHLFDPAVRRLGQPQALGMLQLPAATRHQEVGCKIAEAMRVPVGYNANANS